MIFPASFFSFILSAFLKNRVALQKTANYFPVRTTAEGTDLTTVWADNKTMNDYQILMPFLGDYYQVTKGWAGARTAWWNMLQKVGAGEDIKTVVAAGAAEANAAAAG